MFERLACDGRSLLVRKISHTFRDLEKGFRLRYAKGFSLRDDAGVDLGMRQTS